MEAMIRSLLQTDPIYVRQAGRVIICVFTLMVTTLIPATAEVPPAKPYGQLATEVMEFLTA